MIEPREFKRAVGYFAHRREAFNVLLAAGIALLGLLERPHVSLLLAVVFWVFLFLGFTWAAGVCVTLQLMGVSFYLGRLIGTYEGSQGRREPK